MEPAGERIVIASQVYPNLTCFVFSVSVPDKLQWNSENNQSRSHMVNYPDWHLT